MRTVQVLAGNALPGERSGLLSAKSSEGGIRDRVGRAFRRAAEKGTRAACAPRGEGATMVQMHASQVTDGKQLD